ncbi:OsmC family protein [Stigmatella sp. ncwal1]|uniref:OsmC family protein n=1 Tax=Stigmatella ashevillensis TaxID=2995309 RepID=A0ABT5DKH9_9BACT|nr:OsmC family protein [Stigmatella ashevillena]MDC0713623.1 OsmC family protein [Stigmatella ashevillena]
MSQTHIKVRWKGGAGGSGFLQAGEGLETRVTLPKDFQGLGEAATPENLLLGAVASCYLITFGIILDKARIAYEGLELEGELRMDMGPRPSVQEIVLLSRIVSNASEETLRGLSERAEQFCPIGRTIAGNVAKSIRLTVVAPGT